MRYLLIFLLLFSVASGADLDSTRQARVAVYSLLGLDTTGTKNLPTNTVDFYVNQALQQVNEDLLISKKYQSITLVDGTLMYNVDSIVQAVSAWYLNGDSAYGLAYVSLDTFSRKLEYDQTGTAYPEYYYRWGDSVGFLPPPRQAGTVRLYFVRTIPKDSLRIIPTNLKTGIVYYAAYLAAVDIFNDGSAYLKVYDEFVARKRGVVKSSE